MSYEANKKFGVFVTVTLNVEKYESYTMLLGNKGSLHQINMQNYINYSTQYSVIDFIVQANSSSIVK